MQKKNQITSLPYGQLCNLAAQITRRVLRGKARPDDIPNRLKLYQEMERRNWASYV